MNSFLPLHTVSRLEIDIMEGGEYEDNMSQGQACQNRALDQEEPHFCQPIESVQPSTLIHECSFRREC